MDRPPKKKKLRRVGKKYHISNLARYANSDRGHAQEGDPGRVLYERREEAAIAQPVLEDRVSDVARAREDHHAREPDLETVHVEPVDVECEPEDQVVHNGEGGRGGDTVIGEHVRGHGDLVVDGRVGPDERLRHMRERADMNSGEEGTYAQLLRDGAHAPPVLERVEDELIAA